MRKRLTPAVIVLAALACGAVALAVIVVGSPTATTAASRTATVTRGVVLSTVSGTGNLAPSRQAGLDFPTSGELTAVYVKAGERVVTGRRLARIDDSSAKVDLAQAQADLTSALAAQATAASSSTTSASTSSPATATTTGAATAAAATPTPTPGATRKATPSATPSATATPAATRTRQATATPTASSGSTQSPAEAAAAVAKAELSVTSAEQALTATQLRAPMSGTIAAVTGSVGDTTGPSSSSGSDTSSASTSFITLAKVHRFKVDVSLSESDIGKVKTGQPATVTVNAVSGLELAGHVTNVGVLAASSASSSTSASTSSAVSYPVTVALDQGSSRAKAGMSVSIDIVTGRATGLTVPTQALSGSTVTVVKNGKRSSTRVETGLADDDSTEILSGVKAGDQVAVTSSSAAAGASASRTGGAASQQGTGRRFGGGGLGGGGLGGSGAGPVVRAGGPP